MPTSCVRLALTSWIVLAAACSQTQAPAAKDDPAPGSAAAATKKSEGKPETAKADPHPTDAAAPAATAEVGKPAPDFTLTDLDGTSHSLSALRGKLVVLEWFNPECPFVKYAHTDGPLVDMGAKAIEQGVVWLAINSGAPGKQGHGVDANRSGAETFGMRYPILLDESGSVGRSYGAQKTPHMFVIDPQGVLRYAGGLDNAPFGEVDGGGPRVAYAADAIAAVRGGTEVAVTTAPAWGCTVKYGS